MEEYKTLRAPASDEFTEKRSRFIGYAQPVSTQVEAAAFIERIKKQHHDATHNVFAYLLREGQLEDVYKRQEIDTVAARMAENTVEHHADLALGRLLA